MRYFKCDTIKTEEREIIIEPIPLSSEEKKRARQSKFLGFSSSVVFFIVSGLFLLGGIFMIIQIPIPHSTLLKISVIGLKLIFVIVVFIVSLLLGALASSPLSSMSQKKSVIPKNTVYDKTILYLQGYYGYNEPCIVTKCYESSDKAFKNRDVCIFFTDNDLRITADLKHGFSKRERDLGCYAFKPDEISTAYIQGEFLITELKTEGVSFRLGRRAKKFIENTIKISTIGD